MTVYCVGAVVGAVTRRRRLSENDVAGARRRRLSENDGAGARRRAEYEGENDRRRAASVATATAAIRQAQIKVRSMRGVRGRDMAMALGMQWRCKRALRHRGTNEQRLAPTR